MLLKLSIVQKANAEGGMRPDFSLIHITLRFQNIFCSVLGRLKNFQAGFKREINSKVIGGSGVSDGTQDHTAAPGAVCE